MFSFKFFLSLMHKVRVPPGTRSAAVAKADSETAGASLKWVPAEASPTRIVKLAKGYNKNCMPNTEQRNAHVKCICLTSKKT